MYSLSPEPTTHIQRALTTVVAYLQASNRLEFTKNAWLFLKKSVLEISTAQNISMTTALVDCFKQLQAIEDKHSAPSSCATKAQNLC